LFVVVDQNPESNNTQLEVNNKQREEIAFSFSVDYSKINLQLIHSLSNTVLYFL
jgi:hypothetical protein